MSDEVIGSELIADYLLFWLNKNQNFRYVDFFGLSAPSDDITEVLTYGAIRFEMVQKVKSPEGRWNDQG